MNYGDYENEQPMSSNMETRLSQTHEESFYMVINNSESILNTLKSLYHEQKMCDVFMKVGSVEHAAHRLILCASSDVFQAMLMRPEWSEWHESRIVLKELPQCENVFHLFLEYFYTGKIIIAHSNVMAILALADKYLVKSLTSVCLEYMCKHVAHAAANNYLFSWLQYTSSCGYNDVAKLCQNYIKWNFEAVANTPDFSNFDVELLCDLLKQSDLVVHNEMVLFNCVVRWLELQNLQLTESNLSNQDIRIEMESMVTDVMNCIRFPMMSPHELADLILSPLLKQYSQILLKHMEIGMLFQKGRKEEIDSFFFSDHGKLSCTPRLYTCENFNTTLLIENVASLPSYNVSTYVFSTHMSAAEYEADKISEWVVDLYPKGVCFNRCLLIVWQGTLEVPEQVKSTVRLSLTCRECLENTKVSVGVLLYGLEGGTEHIMQVTQKVHHFNATDCVLIIDNLIPFEELNPQAEETVSNVDKSYRSRYLTGSKRDQLKINIVITPVDYLY